MFAASVLRGFTGFGFGLAAVPLLSLVLPPAEAVPFVIVLQVIIGAAGLRAAWRLTDWRAVKMLTPGLVLGVPVGFAVLARFNPNTVRLAIGFAIALSVAVLRRGVRVRRDPSLTVSLLAGFASGVLNGLASMGGPPIVVYLLASAPSAASVRATSIVYFLIAAIVSALPMVAGALMSRDILLWSAASAPVLFAGSWLGNYAFERAGAHHHRVASLIVLSVLAVVLIARGLM